MITDYRKQSELINAELFDEPITVIGCGATGSWLVFFLLKMGFKNITVCDFDKVEEHNLPNQMFREYDIGTDKVEAISYAYREYFDESNTPTRLYVDGTRMTPQKVKEIDGYVFCCVDNMETRKKLYETGFKKGSAKLWIESRLGLFGSYIYTLTEKTPKQFEAYEATLYDDEEAEVSPCGVSQTALPSAVNCASNMLMQMISYIRGNDVYNEIQYQMPDMYSLTTRW